MQHNREEHMKIKKILAPTDLSELSLVGLRAALELAKESRGKIIVYNVLCLDEFVRFEMVRARPMAVEKLLHEHRREVAKFLELHCGDLLPVDGLEIVVELGNPDDGIVDKAVRESASLIVISTHGRTGLSHILMGSVTESVVRKSPCPVLSIRPESHTKTAVAAA
jgi:nucleotide-binding universal stress UspA family protein